MKTEMTNRQARIEILSKMGFTEGEERRAGTWLERTYVWKEDGIGEYLVNINVAINVTDKTHTNGEKEYHKNHKPNKKYQETKKKEIYLQVLVGHRTVIEDGSLVFSHDLEPDCELIGKKFDEVCDPEDFEKLVQKAKDHFETIWNKEIETLMEKDFAKQQFIKFSKKAKVNVMAKIATLEKRQKELEKYLSKEGK